MKVTLASYHTVTIRRGGAKTQIHRTKKYLESSIMEGESKVETTVSVRFSKR